MVSDDLGGWQGVRMDAQAFLETPIQYRHGGVALCPGIRLSGKMSISFDEKVRISLHEFARHLQNTCCIWGQDSAKTWRQFGGQQQESGESVQLQVFRLPVTCPVRATAAMHIGVLALPANNTTIVRQGKMIGILRIFHWYPPLYRGRS